MNEIEKILDDLTETQKYSILLLSANDFEPIRGKLWFQKELFLLSINLPHLQEDADFEEDLMGPYSEIADEEIEALVKIGVLEKEGNQYLLSELGKSILGIIKNNIRNQDLELISEMKRFLNDMSQEELLGYIYFSFPNMTKESIKYNKIFPNRKEIAIRLFQKDKISLEKASQLAGINIEEMIEELKKKSITIYH